MASNISYDGPNSGLQIAHNHGPITAQFSPPELSLNQACLRDLRTTNPHDDKVRIERTNGGLLTESYRWILDNEHFKQWQDNQGSRLLWIKGDPGKGKTMLLCGIIDELIRSIGDNANISFFFCQATDVRINNATAVLRGLIYSLAEKQPSLLSYVRSRYDQAGKSLFEERNAWIALSNIFNNILKDPTLQNTYVVIDALDECIVDLSVLLDLVAQESSTYSHVKWIVSSRNWPSIQERLDTQAVPISLELNEASVSNAVQQFIRHKVHRLAEVKKYSEEIRDAVYHRLSSHSQGTFLWVALVCQDLNRTSRRHVLKKLKEFPPGLDALYYQMIDQVRSSEDAGICKRILAFMSIAYRPITLHELSALVDLPNDLVDDDEALLEIIAICGSFLTWREDVIVFVHQSAKEFLLEKAQIEIFPDTREAEHLAIFSRSLQTMFKILRHDIFGTYFVKSSTEELTYPRSNPLADIKYACVYWVDHLLEGCCGEDKYHRVDHGGYIDRFLRQKYLHWLEGLGILRCVSEGITAMLKLESVLKKKGESQDLISRVQDASRFVQFYRHAIERSPLQVYSSGLVFSPTQSITRTCYQKEKPGWILNSPAVDESWSSCLQSLEGHNKTVRSISWSPDGSRLASSSDDKTVRIWDPVTGQCTAIIEGHSDSVWSIAWSPKTGQLASASVDKTLRIWDPATGQYTFIFEVFSVSIAWSPDGNRLASALDDKTVRIWDSATGQCTIILKGHGEMAGSISWSPDGSRLASASDDQTARIWDPDTGQCAAILEGHDDAFRSIAWSPDGSRLASSSFDKTVPIWDLATGQCAFTLEGHRSPVTSIAWSPNGSQLASASDDKTVRIWDPATRQCVYTLVGHTFPITSVTWSPDGERLASASDDMTVRVWDPVAGKCTDILEGHNHIVRSIAWSPDGSRLASASFDQTVRIWNPRTDLCASIIEGHKEMIVSITWSPKRSRLASASDDKTVRIWDPASGQCPFILEGHKGSITSMAWSPDGSQLASASDDKTVRIWDLATGQCVSTLEGHRYWINLIAWSSDAKRFASASYGEIVRIWNPTTGKCESTLGIQFLHFLQFDKSTPYHLHTSIGTFNIGSTEPVASSLNRIDLTENYGFGLSEGSSWITFNGLNLLWLPPQYRPFNPGLLCIDNATVAIACSSGRVIFLELSEQNPLSRV